MTAFRATFSDLKLIKTRQVAQLIFEIPIEQFDAAYEILGGVPVPGKERWFGIAALKSTEEETRAAPRQTSSPSTPTGGATREKMDWRDVQPAAQAGIRCEDPIFRAFLKEKHFPNWTKSPLDAAVCVRLICNIESRSELSTNHKARVLWHQLDSEFQAWKALEHA